MQYTSWSRLLHLVALPMLGLSLPLPAAHAETVAGFGTTFAPETWLVVNTNPNQTLTNSMGLFPAMCAGTGPNSGANTNGCVKNYTTGQGLSDSVTLWGLIIKLEAERQRSSLQIPIGDPCSFHLHGVLPIQQIPHRHQPEGNTSAFWSIQAGPFPTTFLATIIPLLLFPAGITIQMKTLNLPIFPPAPLFPSPSTPTILLLSQPLA